MRHADWLVERILFLDGLPNLQNLGKLHIGEDGVEALECDLKLEMVARDDTATAIALFEKEEDYVSRDIATRILVDSEEHVDFLGDAARAGQVDRPGELPAVGDGRDSGAVVASSTIASISDAQA